MSPGVILLNYVCFFDVKNGLFWECGPWDPPQGPLSVKYHFWTLELGLLSTNWHASMFYSKFRSKSVKKYTPGAKQSKTRLHLKRKSPHSICVHVKGDWGPTTTSKALDLYFYLWSSRGRNMYLPRTPTPKINLLQIPGRGPVKAQLCWLVSLKDDWSSPKEHTF